MSAPFLVVRHQILVEHPLQYSVGIHRNAGDYRRGGHQTGEQTGYDPALVDHLSEDQTDHCASVFASTLSRYERIGFTQTIGYFRFRRRLYADFDEALHSQAILQQVESGQRCRSDDRRQAVGEQIGAGTLP